MGERNFMFETLVDRDLSNSPEQLAMVQGRLCSTYTELQAYSIDLSEPNFTLLKNPFVTTNASVKDKIK